MEVWGCVNVTRGSSGSVSWNVWTERAPVGDEGWMHGIYKNEKTTKDGYMECMEWKSVLRFLGQLRIYGM